MPSIKHYKVEKVGTEILAQKAMDVCREMLGIICDRTSKDGEDDAISSINTELHYFGSGQQLKISKVADSLYSSLKDVLGYVMVETAKRSDCDCKFQMPKHTSYIGAIVKSTAIDVIARNVNHQKYIQSLISQTNKYRFDASSNQFLTLYYDTILKLYERGYLFDDDPEFEEIRQLLNKGAARSTTDAAGNISVTLYSNTPIEARLTTRNRVIFPYLRRLLETQKAATVTKRRVEFLNEQIQPDAEIQHVFQEKYDEAMRQSSEHEIGVSLDVIRAHCQFQAFNYLKENYSKERVEQFRTYLKSERSINTRSHKRYITIPSKRSRTEAFTTQYEENPPKMQETAMDNRYSHPREKTESVEGVINSNMLIIESAPTTDTPVVMSIDSHAFN